MNEYVCSSSLKQEKKNKLIHIYQERFSIYDVNNSFFLLDRYSLKDQLYSIIENEDGNIMIEGWNYQKPIYHPFSPHSIKISSKEIILKIIHSESSMMKNHSCKIMNTTNGQHFLIFKNKYGKVNHLHLDN